MNFLNKVKIVAGADAKSQASAILTEIAVLAKKLIAKYKKDVAGTDSVPSYPDTSKFLATRSGMIEYMSGEQQWPHVINSRGHMSAGVKVGSNVNSNVHKSIKDALFKVFSKHQKKIGGDTDRYIRLKLNDDEKYGDHYGITFTSIVGTNWSAYGIKVQTPDGSLLRIK